MSKFKKDFPIFKNFKKMIYLDSAATTQKPEVVVNAQKEFYYKHNANSHRGLYDLSIKATAILNDSRKIIADFINASSDEIIFTKSATEGFNMLANTLGEDLGRWENIVVTSMEHHSNFIPWQQLCKRTKAKFIVVKYDKDAYELEDVVERVDLRTHIVAITYMSNVTGEILDIKKIIERIRERNPKTIIIVDATQAVVHTKIDVKDLDADFLCFSSHKVYGPTGVGVVYGKKELLEKINPFLYGGNMISSVTEKESTWAEIPEKFEAGTLDVAGIYAFGKAIEYLREKDEIFKIENELKNYALQELKKLDNVKIIGHNKKSYGPIISFHVMDVHPHDLAEVCSRENICIRAGNHCAQPLMISLDLIATARLSLSFYNEKKDIDKLISAISKARKIING